MYTSTLFCSPVLRWKNCQQRGCINFRVAETYLAWDFSCKSKISIKSHTMFSIITATDYTEVLQNSLWNKIAFKEEWTYPKTIRFWRWICKYPLLRTIQINIKPSFSGCTKSSGNWNQVDALCQPPCRFTELRASSPCFPLGFSFPYRHSGDSASKVIHKVSCQHHVQVIIT